MKPKDKEMMPLKQTSTLILPENIYFKNTAFKQMKTKGIKHSHICTKRNTFSGIHWAEGEQS